LTCSGKVRELLPEVKASFVVTGEVLGQCSMSQHRRAIEIIERESGLKGLILRPLSARLLPPTVPESEGIVDRPKLLDLAGRSRKPQMALAGMMGITDYPCPAGGCSPDGRCRRRAAAGRRCFPWTGDWLRRSSGSGG
jgi:hypothetical protein